MRALHWNVLLWMSAGTSEPRRAHLHQCTKNLTSPLCEVVRCRAMPRQEMHSCKFWRQRRWRESRLAPLTWLHLAPARVNIMSVSSLLKELRSSMARFDMEQRYLSDFEWLFEVQTWDGLRCSSQFSLEVDFNFDPFDSSASSLRHNCHLWSTILWGESRTCCLQ